MGPIVFLTDIDCSMIRVLIAFSYIIAHKCAFVKCYIGQMLLIFFFRVKQIVTFAKIIEKIKRTLYYVFCAADRHAAAVPARAGI